MSGRTYPATANSPRTEDGGQQTVGKVAVMKNEMKRVQESELDANATERRPSEGGWTLIEVIGVVFIVGILATIGINLFANQREKVRLVKCMAEIRGIQASVMDMGDGRYIPLPEQFWANAWPDGRKHGPYYYLTDGDPNAGHGNDLDGVDEENPGASDPDKKDIKFVILCDHDHGDLAEYVYLTDEEAPQVVRAGSDHPDYERFIKWEYGGPGANSGKKPK